VKEGLGWKLRPERRSKSQALGLAGLAGGCQNRYITANLWFSYDRVLRVGPPGPALFYYLNEPEETQGPAQPVPPDRLSDPASNQRKTDRPK
jgi:hypothetical protein